MLKKKSLLAVQGPTQFITAYIACMYYERMLDTLTDLTIVVYDTFVPEENEDLFEKAINTMSSFRKWDKLIYIGSKEMKEISLNTYSKCISKLKSKIDHEDIDYIYIARDFGSFGTQLILNSYPKAFKVEYGDSFGLVGNEQMINYSFGDFWKNPIIFAKSLIKKILFRQFPQRFSFDVTILSLPLDCSGTYLDSKSLIIPDKDFVKQKCSDFASQLNDLDDLCERLIGNKNKDLNLYLLSNFANSGFSTKDDEVRLYEEIVRETARIGSKVLLKNHPRGTNEILEGLKERLKNDYCVEVINYKQFSFYPIELWQRLINNANIFAVFSSSVVSLSYIYSKKVLMPLDEVKINKYIFKNKVAETMLSEEMCRNAALALKDWDGLTVLWKNK